MEQKSHVWDRIQSHMDATRIVTQPSSVSVRPWRVRKWTTSGVLIAAMFGVLYGIWGLQEDNVIFDNKVFTLLRPQQETTTPRVLASSVGQVIDVDGDYSIVNDGVTYRTNMLYDGDIVSLVDGSRLSFRVDGHQAHIVGPASVAIAREDDGYRFVMMEGEFLEVFSSRTDTGTKLTVQMRDILLAHDAHDTTMQVQLTVDEAGDTIVKNYADTVLVARVDDASDATDLDADMQLTLAPESTIETTTPERFSLDNIVFLGEVSDEVKDGAAALVVLADVPASDVREQSSSVIETLTPSVDEGTVDMVASSTTLTDSGAVTDDVAMMATARVVEDRLLPTDTQLGLLRTLITSEDVSSIRVRDQIASAYGCVRLPAGATDAYRTVQGCVSTIMDSYYIPPSLVDGLTAWLAQLSTSMTEEAPDDASPVIETGSVQELDVIVEEVTVEDIDSLDQLPTE